MRFPPARSCVRLPVALLAALFALPAAGEAERAAQQPEIVPLLVAGADTRDRAAEARAAQAQSKSSLQGQPLPAMPGPSARLAEALADLRAVTDNPTKRSADLMQVIERLRAVDALMQVAPGLLAEQPLSQALGVGSVLQQRAGHSQARWKGATAPVIAAAEALAAESSPGSRQAKAAEQRLDAELQTLLSPAKAPAAAVSLPVHRPGLAPAALSVANLIAPSYANAEDPLPLTEDLLPSGEVQFTPGVLAKAQELGYRYVELFDFVRSSVQTEWSAGSTQSPDRTLRRLAGNDVEQASLLIALLRASGAPARYVVGVVEVPAADLAEQIGVPVSELGRALTAAGIPHRPRTSAGQTVAYQIRHVWVSARVPYGNYRGTVADGTEPTWIPLMPALKPTDFDPGAGVHSRLSHDMSAWMQAYLGQAQAVAPWPELRQRWAAALAALQPPVELSGLGGRHGVAADSIGLLPSSTPYAVIAVQGEFGQLPDTERQWLQLRLRDPAQPQAQPLLETRLALAELASHRFTLGFIPARVEDQHMTNANGSVGGFPLHLIRLRPSLMLEGQPARPGRGEVVGGELLEMELTLATPNGGLVHRQAIHAGSIAGFAIDPHGDPRLDLEPAPAQDETPDAGRVLNRFAQRYLAEWSRAERDSATLMGVRVLRPAPALALALPRVQPMGAGGLIERLEFQGVALDAALRPLEPVALHAQPGLERDWLRLTALHGSALESRLFEELWAVPSASADSLFQQAAAEAVPMLQLSPGADLGPLAQHSDEVRAHVARWLAMGKRISIPQRPLVKHAWTGSAWRVEDEASGESGYFVSGGYAGGVTALAPGLWYFRDLAALLDAPYSERPNPDPDSVAHLKIYAESQFQVARAGEHYERELAAVALDETGRPVEGARVRFVVREGGLQLMSEFGDSGVEAVLTSDRYGLVRLIAVAPQQLQGLWRLPMRDELGRLTYARETRVLVSARQGQLSASQDLVLLTLPGPLFEFQFSQALGATRGHTLVRNIAGFSAPHDSWTFVLPQLEHVHSVLRGLDRFGNAVGGEVVTIEVSDRFEAGCLAASSAPTIPSMAYTRSSGCPSVLPLGSNDCLSANLELTLGPSGEIGLSVAPTNIVRTIVAVSARSGDIGGVHEFEVGMGDYHNDAPFCSSFSWHHSIFEIVAPAEYRVARLGETFPRPRRFLSFWIASVGNAVIRPTDQLLGLTEDASLIQVEGANASPIRRLGVGDFEFDLVADAAPQLVRAFVELVISGPGGATSQRLNFAPAWALHLDPPAIDPAPLFTSEFQRALADYVVSAPFQPASFRPEQLALGIFDAEGEMALGRWDLQDGASAFRINRGSFIDVQRARYLQYIINPHSTNPIESEAVPVPLASALIAGYGGLASDQALPQLDLLGGDRFPRVIEFQTEIDIQTDFICRTGNRLMFALGQNASLDLDIFALDENGARGPLALRLFQDEAFERGVHAETLDIDRLPFGVYEFELRARTDRDEETRTGRLINREKRRGALPLSRSFVKGVDVHDGHAVISETDVAIGGRGPGLRFTRTYSSHSGDDYSLLGRGWQSDLDASIVPDSCGSYIVTGAAGQGQRYVPNGTYADGSPRFRSANGFNGTLRLAAGGGFDFYSKDGTRHHFGIDHRIQFIEDTAGNRVSYEYGSIGSRREIVRVVDAAGRVLQLNYETRRLERALVGGLSSVSHRVLLGSISAPGGLRIEYEYSADGNLTRVTRRQSESASGDVQARRVQEYSYEDFGGIWMEPRPGQSRYYHLGFRLHEARDAIANTVRTYRWQTHFTGLRPDPQADILRMPELRVRELEESDGGTVAFAYSGLRPLEPTTTIVTDARGHESRYEMNRAGGTVRLSTPAGITLTDWDLGSLKPRQVTDPLLTVTTYTFDDHGNQTGEHIQHAAGELTRSWEFVPPSVFDRPIKDRLSVQVDARGIETRYAYDARGLLTGQTRGEVSEHLTHDERGDLVSRQNGRGDLSTFTYDGFGYLISAADDLGPLHSATYDARGRKLSERNGAGEETVYTYDTLDRLRSLSHAFGTRTIDYDDAARTRTERDERGHPRSFVHDAQGRVLREIDADENQRVFAYDTHGNLLSETDFRGQRTEHEYDAANRRVLTLAPLGRQLIYTHDALGNVLSEDISGGDSEPQRSQYAYAHPLNLRTLERRWIAEDDWAESHTQYDGNGNPVLRIDAEGRQTTLSYDARDRLVEVAGPGTRLETFSYDAADHRIGAELNTSRPQRRAWAHDARGQQTRYTDATAARWEQGFDLAGRLVASIDPLGNTVTYSYDAAGRLIRESGPRADQFVAYTLDAAGNRVGVEDSAGRVLVNTFDVLNRLESSTDDDGLVERLEYDPDGRIVLRENGRGEITRFEFNALGHEILRTLPPNQAGERALAFTPGIHGELLAETDANGNTTGHRYDGLGRRVRSTLPAVPGGMYARRWTYDRVGNVLSHIDAAGRTTEWSYTPRNQRLSQTDPAPPGTEQIWTYDAANNVVGHIDRRGIVHGWRYDGENRLIEQTRAGLRIERLAYDLAGRVDTRTDARDEDTHYTYDAGGSVLSERRPLGFAQHWTYTPWGGVETHTDADGLVRSFEYDARQRLIAETDPAGQVTTHAYDEVDNRIRTVRPGPTEWAFGFDPDGRLIEVLSPQRHRTEYRHDRHGNRVEQRDAAGVRTRYTFDARHRVTAIDHPVGGDEGFAYNGEGELTEHTDRAGQRIEIDRDGLGRITERRYGAAISGEVHRETFALDGDGRPTLISQFGEPGGPYRVQRRYDAHGRLVEEDDRYGQRSHWTHDEVGNRLQLRDPAGTTDTAPDRLNRITRLSTAAGSSSLGYTPAGRLDHLLHPNGARSDYAYDRAGRIERIVHRQGGSEVARFEYAHDARGNRREERRIDASGTQLTTYTYDDDDRLTGTTVTAADGSVTETVYTLDAVGNRSREVVRRGSTVVSDISYTYQSHQRLTRSEDSVSGVVTDYTYDARGHLTSETRNGQTTTYRPNAQDRLATLTLPGAPPIEVDYAYDAEGKRVERRTPTELTRFGWDGETLRRETNAANNVVEAHDWAAGRILSSRRLTDTRYAQHDALRSPIRWSTSTGAEQGQLRYDAWGETTDTSPDLPRIAYTGHYREREGSAYYAQQRYYQPRVGRFNRVDPWEGDPLRPVTLNKYLYANGNPLLYVDPDGRCGMQLGDDFCQLGAAVANGWSPEQYREHVKIKSQAERDASEAALGFSKGVAKVGAEGVWDTLKLGLSLAKALGGNTEAGDEVMGVLRGGAGVVADPGRAYNQASASFGEGLDEQNRLMASGDIGGAWETRGRLVSGFIYAVTPLATRSSLLSQGAAANRVQRAEPLTVVDRGRIDPAAALDRRMALIADADFGPLNAPAPNALSQVAGNRVVTFGGAILPRFLDKADASLGPPGGTVWVMPMDDAARIRSRSDVVTQTGRAPGVTGSYKSGLHRVWCGRMVLPDPGPPCSLIGWNSSSPKRSV